MPGVTALRAVEMGRGWAYGGVWCSKDKGKDE